MSNSAAKVGEIFTEAGAAFNKLAEMTMLLHSMTEPVSSSQVKTPVKRKVVEDRPMSGTNPSSQSQHNLHTSPISQQVTLNMLNAPETEERINQDVKLEFVSSAEGVS